MSIESAFCEKVSTKRKAMEACSHFGEFPESQESGSQRIRDPLAALHLANSLLSFCALQVELDAINSNRLDLSQGGQPFFPLPRLEREREH